jgi:ubiquinone/menaquinone biosynthesis C-methylase UbiE
MILLERMQVDSKTIQDFNRWSETYEDSWLQRILFDRVQNARLDLVAMENIPGTILNIGCGTGLLLHKLKERWPKAQLVGIDPSEGMVGKARQLIPEATLYVSMVESIPLPDNSIDLITSTISFHHWADQLQGLREVARVLRPGGRFFLADIVSPKFLHHGQPRTQAEIRSMFDQAGLEVQLHERIFWRTCFITVGRKA